MSFSLFPLTAMTNVMQMGWVMAEAQSVIAMRVLGAMGVWSVPKSENDRMVSEKVFAFWKGSTDATLAMMAGASPELVMKAAIAPVRSKTRANHRRLTRRGLRR